jgi:hypothetical protein
MMSPASTPALSAGWSFSTPVHQRTTRRTQADGLGHLLVDRTDLHADAAAHDAPVGAQLIRHTLASSIGMAKLMPMKPPERL